ncbi:MAG: hypothetical protein M0Q88_09635 [Bacilli bacterium]|nr:hypothetical protein [Bacilli bacterium]
MLNSPGYNNELLLQLEDLGALTSADPESSSGLINIKPFRDWTSTVWSKKVFTFRLCNVGELIDINNELDKLPAFTREFASKIEFVLRSIYKIDDKIFVPEEEVAKYNERNNTKLSRIEYLRAWVKNVEGIVINRLYSIYEALESKQIRLLTDRVMCEITGNIFIKDEIPEGSYFIKNCIGEIISKKGLESELFNKSLYEVDIISNDNENSNNDSNNDSDNSSDANDVSDENNDLTNKDG